MCSSSTENFHDYIRVRGPTPTCHRVSFADHNMFLTTTPNLPHDDTLGRREHAEIFFFPPHSDDNSLDESSQIQCSSPPATTRPARAVHHCRLSLWCCWSRDGAKNCGNQNHARRNKHTATCRSIERAADSSELPTIIIGPGNVNNGISSCPRFL